MPNASPPHPIPEHPVRGRHYRYYDLVMAAFVAVLLCSNLIGPAKTCQIHLPFSIWLPFGGGRLGDGWTDTLVFGAGNLFFPISYIFGDVLTEVYGFARTRKVIWAGFGAMLFATVMTQIILRMPLAQDESYNRVLQPALETVFGGTWRIVAGSIIAFWAGDFVNGYVLAKMKVMTRGRWLWSRTIGSTIAGQAVDSLIFYPLAFYGIWETKTLVGVVVFNWFFKVSVEAVLTPLTYLVVNFLKRAEREDFYDVGTDFTPFSLDD
jgi:uncharacterized integral membrane protein (TIGR00697 family)